MTIVRSMEELKEEVNARIARGLLGRPLDIVIETLQESALENVYMKYEPKSYKRRGDQNGGLMAKESFEPDVQAVVSRTTLDVYNVARGNFSKNSEDYADDLAAAISYGWGELKRPYERPRPFFPQAREALQWRKDEIARIIVDAVKKG